MLNLKTAHGLSKSLEVGHCVRQVGAWQSNFIDVKVLRGFCDSTLKMFFFSVPWIIWHVPGGIQNLKFRVLFFNLIIFNYTSLELQTLGQLNDYYDLYANVNRYKV